MSNQARSRWYTVGAFVVVFIALFIVIGRGEASKNDSIRRIDNERERAILGECRAANEAIGQIRVAIRVTAGYQSTALAGASPELRAQIEAGNARRSALAESATAKIKDIRCPGDARTAANTTEEP